MSSAMPISVLSQSPLTVPHRSRVCLFADDFTGASDAAVAFLPAGHSVRVWFGPTALQSTSESVQAFNSNSRSLTPVEATAAVSRATSGIFVDANTLLFKKIDSAARGPIAAELLAAHRTLGTQAILLAPGFPAAGRSVSNGILHIQDSSGHHTQIYLGELFPAEMQPLIAFVRSPALLAEAYASGKTILVCDAVTQTDLEALARTASNLPGIVTTQPRILLF